MRYFIIIIDILALSIEGFSQIKENDWGEDYWIGHVYKATSSPKYAGYYIEEREFSQDFGGPNTIFKLNNGKINTNYFFIKYQMITKLKGCYIFNIKADKGARLIIDEEFVFNIWTESSNAKFSNILINLKGNSKLKIQYYDDFKDNVIEFNNLTKLNSISKNESQSVCSGILPEKIVGSEKMPKLKKDGELYSYANITKYKWEYRKNNEGWKIAPGIYNSKNYSPPIKYNYSSINDTYKYRRITTYIQNSYKQGKKEYIDSTAIATIIVKPSPSGSLSCNDFYCENNDDVQLKFSGNISGEKYIININDENRDTIFNDISSGSILNLFTNKKEKQIYKIKSLTTSKGNCTTNYKEGKEPFVMIEKHKTTKTSQIHHTKN